MEARQKPLPVFCFCCGQFVKRNETKCSYHLCSAMVLGEEFCKEGKNYCAHCKSYPNGLSVFSKQCPSCDKPLNAAIVNPYKYVFH